jgi:hypothetical protein
MARSYSRAFLTSTAFSALTAAAASLIAPAPAEAQSVCSITALNVLGCVDGVTATATGTVNAGTTLITGPGLTANSATDLIANVTGQITTSGDNQPAIFLTALDDLIFTIDDTVKTVGDNSDGVNLTGASVTADLTDVITQGINAQGVQILSTQGPTNLTVDPSTPAATGQVRPCCAGSATSTSMRPH